MLSLPAELPQEASPLLILYDGSWSPDSPWVDNQNPQWFALPRVFFAIGRRNRSLSWSLWTKWCSSNKKALVVCKKGRGKLNCINFKLYQDFKKVKSIEKDGLSREHDLIFPLSEGEVHTIERQKYAYLQNQIGSFSVGGEKLKCFCKPSILTDT